MQLHDLVVAIERTGEYHRPRNSPFDRRGFDTSARPSPHLQTIPPARRPRQQNRRHRSRRHLACHHSRLLGCLEPIWPRPLLTSPSNSFAAYAAISVDKNATLQRQIREVLHRHHARLCRTLCHSLGTIAPAPLYFARHTTSAEAIRQAGLTGLQQLAAQGQLRCRAETFPQNSRLGPPAPPDLGHTFWSVAGQLCTLDDDRLSKTKHILELERDLAQLVVHTPYVLLLAIPGINLVTVADLAGELGPIEFYLNANAITGRAGLMPSRYQSDQVDHANGPLPPPQPLPSAVLMQTADNLAQCNNYFRARASQWKRDGKDARWIRVKIAKIFSRLAFAVVAGRQLFPDACCQPHHYLLGKLLDFHGEHATDPLLQLRDLQAVVEQLPAEQLRQRTRRFAGTTRRPGAAAWSAAARRHYHRGAGTASRPDDTIDR